MRLIPQSSQQYTLHSQHWRSIERAKRHSHKVWIKICSFGNELVRRFILSVFTGNKFLSLQLHHGKTGGYVEFDWFRMTEEVVGRIKEWIELPKKVSGLPLGPHAISMRPYTSDVKLTLRY